MEDNLRFEEQNDENSDSSDSDEDFAQFEVALHGEILDSDLEEEDQEAANDGLDNADQDELNNGVITFDKSLPGAHAYLGNDLEEVRGRTIHDDGTYLTLPLLSLPGVVLVPGQTLPLHIFQPSTVAMIRRIVDSDKTFGLITSRYMGHELNSPTLSTIGTTAEILAIKEETEESVGITTVRVKAIGRQRFEVKESRRTVDGTIQAKVHILPERVLSDPLEGAEPQSVHRVRLAAEQSSDKGAGASGDGPSDLAAQLQSFLTQNKPRKIDKHWSANMTWWPPWVYKQYDAVEVMKKVKNELMSWSNTIKQDQMPADPVEFSYWVAGNLPLDDSMKLHLLRIDSAVQRLRCELNIMQKCTVLCCSDCGLLITNKKEVFSLCLEGPMSAFVNPGGYVHETLTVYKTHGLSLIGRPSTENSWFPGYAWTIAQCRNCHRHMGWRFTAVRQNLKPEKFFGLTRSALVPGLQQGEEEHSEEWQPVM